MEHALAALESVAARAATTLGHHHPLALVAECNVAAARFEHARLTKSVLHASAALTTMRAAADHTGRYLGEHHPHALTALSNLATASFELARVERTAIEPEVALATLEAAYRRAVAVLGYDHATTRVLHHELVLCGQWSRGQDDPAGGAGVRTLQRVDTDVSFEEEYISVEKARELLDGRRPETSPFPRRSASTSATSSHSTAEAGEDVEAGIVALWRSYGESHDQGQRDRLVLHYAPLVKYVAGRVGTGLPAHVDVADLIQSGIFGLVDAIEKFEPERGLKFETYAMQRIRGAILDDLRSQDWVPRSVRSRARDVERALERLGAKLQRTPTDRELAAELKIGLAELRELYGQLQLTSVVALDELIAPNKGGSSLAESLPDDAAEDPVASLVDQDSRRQLADAIAQLAERDRVVVTLYYFENLTLAEIGKVLGVTESRVCQLHTRAVLRLRTKLNEQSEA